ncbi:hypothetical protein SO694_00078191 [Aureococcus anophagefferens]|uniref:Uncharacterized protein n=1 Tax=Aureococcus anophagefferens TaxID=44056 RepID=A0ABR1FH79_AURAN
MWCLRMRSAFKSGAFDPADCDTEMCLSMATSPCAQSCVGADGSFARGRVVRARARGDAMVHFDAFCDGTWTPALPAAVGAVKDGDDDAAYAAAKALGADGGNDVDDRKRSTIDDGEERPAAGLPDPLRQPVRVLDDAAAARGRPREHDQSLRALGGEAAVRSRSSKTASSMRDPRKWRPPVASDAPRSPTQASEEQYQT